MSDSLELVYTSGKYKPSEELSLIKKIASKQTSAEKILEYSELLIAKAELLDSTEYIVAGYFELGDAYRLLSELPQALESYLKAAKIAELNNLSSKEAALKIAIADVYSITDDGKTAVKFYKEALRLLDPEEDALVLATAMLNLGDEFFNQEMYDSSLYYSIEGGAIFKEKDYDLGFAFSLGNMGLVYAEMGDHIQAESNLNKAIKTLTDLQDFYPICVYLNAMADVYETKGESQKSLTYAEKSLSLAKQYGFKEQISDSSLKLSSIHEKNGDIAKALSFYKTHIIYRDSVNSVDQVQELANIRTDYEVSRKQIEVDLLNQQKKTQKFVVAGIGFALLLIGIFAFGLFKRNKFMKRTNDVIANSKKRSDDLLKNILPEGTAKELKMNGFVKAKKFEEVSVLFTDFKGFTKESSNLAPEMLVKSIDYYFSKFDEIITNYGLEKIKTIGDSYMCAGGLPLPLEDHAMKICQAALEIVDFVQKIKKDPNHILASFDVRVGINTGPVVAGVVGTKKFQYDIWGDTVNTASRMESSSEIGKVNISESTYEKLKEYNLFEFTSRGELETKGKGKIAMYYVYHKK